MTAKKARSNVASPSQGDTLPVADVPATPPSGASPRPAQSIPGGRYIVDGVLVNCWGKPIDKDGRVLGEGKP